MAVTALAAVLGFTVPAGAQQPAGVKNLKFQSTWPASLTFRTTSAISPSGWTS